MVFPDRGTGTGSLKKVEEVPVATKRMEPRLKQGIATEHSQEDRYR